MMLPNSLGFLLLVSLFRWISCTYYNNTEQRELVSWLESDFVETPEGSVITVTTTITVGDEKFDDNQVRKLFEQNFKRKNVSEEENTNGYNAKQENFTYENVITTAKIKLQRKTRLATNKTTDPGTPNYQCLSCFAKGTSSIDLACYSGYRSKVSKINCYESDQCFVELNPEYLRRGCKSPVEMNKTFVCSCPLCNDKPSYDSTYYNYPKVEDWRYDNYIRLKRKPSGLELICKYCQSKSGNKASEKACKLGANVDQVTCNADQLCYTNIDDENDRVSRGCINQPAFNSLYNFCTTNLCNDEDFWETKQNSIENVLIPLSARRSFSSTNCCNSFNIMMGALFTEIIKNIKKLTAH